MTKDGSNTPLARALELGAAPSERAGVPMPK
jgi:hypothetical protein